MVEKPEVYPYSSYQSYIFSNKDHIVSQDLILELISGKKGDAEKRYKKFVESAIGRELENPIHVVLIKFSRKDDQVSSYFSQHERT